MFFSVTQTPDLRFPNNRQVDRLWINYDSGWRAGDGVLCKGYLDNYCRIGFGQDGVTVDHSPNRSFPLWFEHGFITNLFSNQGQRAWASDHLHMNPNGQIVWTPIELDQSVPNQQLTTDQARSQIRHMLDLAVADLRQPVKLFCSGGLDTFLIYSMLRHHGTDFELVTEEHFESDSFIEMNRQAIEHYWSYRQLHHWNRPTWLATGGCGDEYFLRGPAVIAELAAWHGVNISELLADQYHSRHFAKYQDLWAQEQRQYATREELNAQMLDMLLNDHQHWHLGETITWTPFKNIEIARTLLQCDIADLIPQFLDGSITKQLIADYCPEVLDFVSTYKNCNSQEKLDKFYRWHSE